ncbi:MAG: GFA family protein [Wenzhouxiangellaceae bacterium]|nr:GFA family protein [Wenzhouxiangellaceae bacterium]
MKLEGSCHCGAVRFRCESKAPYPFNFCYCSICRKSGGNGSACNIHADATSLELEGQEHIAVYKAFVDHPERTRRSQGERRFCRDCGSPLWVQDPRWPDLIHPFASVIDTALPLPPQRHHVMLESKADWVPLPSTEHDRHFMTGPNESLMEWHERHGLVQK